VPHPKLNPGCTTENSLIFGKVKEYKECAIFGGHPVQFTEFFIIHAQNLVLNWNPYTELAKTDQFPQNSMI